ncbi:hypothetical protein MKY04_09335 [Lysinibacillus telephonicus]|uniref:hypothetical protein n=1 Tax=Lysinibacillus telephonicus TaxID=1714840 RepID=UPI0031FC76A9
MTGTGDLGDIWGNLGIPPETVDSIIQYVQIGVENFEAIKAAITSFVDEVIVPLMPKAQEMIGPTMEFIGNIIGGVINVVETLSTVIRGVIENVIVPLFPVAQDVISTVMDFISPILRIVGSLISGISDVIKFLVEEIVVPLFPLIPATIEAAWVILEPVLGFIADMFDGIADSIEWVIDKVGVLGNALKNFDIGDKISKGVEDVTGWLPGFEVGLGRVPYDDMPALLHKDEAVLPAEEANFLRDAGILKGDGTGPTLDFGSSESYAETSQVRGTSTSSTVVQAPVNIVVQGGNTNEETGVAIKDALDEYFGNLNTIIPTPREG